jgi:hypothetical protein
LQGPVAAGGDGLLLLGWLVLVLVLVLLALVLVLALVLALVLIGLAVPQRDHDTFVWLFASSCPVPPAVLRACKGT